MLISLKWHAVVGLLLLFAAVAETGRTTVTSAAPLRDVTERSTDSMPTAGLSSHVSPRIRPPSSVDAIEAVEALDDATPTLPPVDDPAYLPASLATAYASAQPPAIEPPVGVPAGAIELPAAIATAYATFGAASMPTPRPTKTPLPTMTATPTTEPTSTPKPTKTPKPS
jgi:hypothetical protein